MPYLATTITPKGQITIPADIRVRWGLTPFQKMVFTEEKNAIQIKPAVDFFSLKGSVSTKKKFSDQKANRAIKKFFQNNA